MAKIHGISGSTRYLLNGTKPISGKRLTTFEEVMHFHKNYERILAETELTVSKQEDEIIISLGEEEEKLENCLMEGLSYRTIEVDAHISEIQINAETADGFFLKFKYRIQYWIESSLRDHRINSPFKQIRQNLHNTKSQKNHHIAHKPQVIKKACKNITDTQNFLSNNSSFVIGAMGEESVINILVQLPDEYHVLNDVNLYFPKYIYWRERNEHIRTCQIDHIVIGPTGVFLLETKKWKTSDIEIKSDDLKHQIRRASYALWYYLKDHYLYENKPRVQNVLVSMHGAQYGQKIDKYIDIVYPSRLCAYITTRRQILSDEAIHNLIRLIPCREVG